jgi:hypothetical protein
MTDALSSYDERAIGSLRYLQAKCHDQASRKGFWDDEPARGSSDLQHYQGNKLMLIVTEVTEAHEQLRNGHHVANTYYPTAPPTTDLLQQDRVGIHKPEGVPSELADTIIRAFDFAGKYNIDLAGMIFEKLAYNATRPFKHGKAF